MKHIMSKLHLFGLLMNFWQKAHSQIENDASYFTFSTLTKCYSHCKKLLEQQINISRKIMIDIKCHIKTPVWMLFCDEKLVFSVLLSPVKPNKNCNFSSKSRAKYVSFQEMDYNFGFAI